MKNLKISILKPLFECLGIAAASLIIVNFIALLANLLKNGWNENSKLVFKHGSFYLNDNITGLPWAEGKTNGFLLIALLISLLIYYKKGRFSNLSLNG